MSDPHSTAPASKPLSSRTNGVENCWSRIGVHGDGSCPELPKFIHCRNCDIFSNAARQVLDRPLTEEYRREWTTHFALEKKPAVQTRLSAVIFRIGADWLALPTQAFQEVAERRRIHSLPHRRQGVVLGLANVRGELLICVALGRLLGLRAASSLLAVEMGRDRLLVAAWQGSRLAFPVDEVQGIHRFESGEVREIPATVAKSQTNFSEGIVLWREKAVGVLNPALLFPALNNNLE